MNQHPHFRVDFEQWCKRVESNLATGERFFVNRVGLFDAMPMFWKQMSGENRHAVVAIIDGIMTQAKTNEENLSPWRIINVLELLKYVALDDLQQLRGCYHICTIDPSVFLGQSRIKLCRLKPCLQKQFMPLDGIQRSMWTPSGEKQSGKGWFSSWAVWWGKLKDG